VPQVVLGTDDDERADELYLSGKCTGGRMDLSPVRGRGKRGQARTSREGTLLWQRNDGGQSGSALRFCGDLHGDILEALWIRE